MCVLQRNARESIDIRVCEVTSSGRRPGENHLENLQGISLTPPLLKAWRNALSSYFKPNGNESALMLRINGIHKILYKLILDRHYVVV